MSARKLGRFCVAVVLLMFSGTALSQDQCRPFGGTLYGWHDGKAWAGEGDFMVGGQKLHAKVVDVNTAIEKHGDMWWGTETATFDFGEGNRVELLTEFTTEHMTNVSGVFHVNEIGTFANGTGSFRKASGHFTSQGPFGPGVRLPGGKAKPPAGASMYWIGHYDGVICGIGK
jgi:hypothetical protein